MIWEYSDVEPGKPPTCPCCSGRRFKPPAQDRAKWECLTCGATFKAKLIEARPDGRTERTRGI